MPVSITKPIHSVIDSKPLPPPSKSVPSSENKERRDAAPSTDRQRQPNSQGHEQGRWERGEGRRGNYRGGEDRGYRGKVYSKTNSFAVISPGTSSDLILGVNAQVVTTEAVEKTTTTEVGEGTMADSNTSKTQIILKGLASSTRASLTLRVLMLVSRRKI